MKIMLPIPALVAFLGFALISAPVTAQAQTTTTPPATAPVKTKSKKSDTIEYGGTLTAIDPSGKSITVTGAKHTLVLEISPTTKFKPNAPALTSFAVGDKVTGSYTLSSAGVMTAHSVHKKAPKADKSAKAAAPTDATATPTTPAVK